LLFGKIQSTTEVIFGDEIVGFQQYADYVLAQCRRGGERVFDLVIGADGLHSNVRRLVFGPQDRFEKQLGYMVAAFEVRGYRPRDEDVYVIYGEPGRMLGRFALHDDRSLFLFVFAAEVDSLPAVPDLPTQKAMLRERFGDGKWECPRVLDELDRAQDLYFDRVSQIKMYERLLRAYIVSKQRAAERFASAFAPKTRWGLFLRNQVITAFAIPGLARLAFGRDLIDTLQLPDYAWPALAAFRDLKCVP
jgi:2-polyprenyl-6-methoxyphenol hydroxylase-like FAD-dependent oxidoreductase